MPKNTRPKSATSTASTSTSTKGKGKGKGKSSTNGKQDSTSGMKYPEVYVEVHGHDNPITIEKTEELLGWVTEEEGVGGEFGDDYAILDRNGKKVKLLNNMTNRPIYPSVLADLVQEHLMKRWDLNGETIIIGQYGSVLDGQHSLISHKLAEQDRTSEKHKARWEDYGWEGPITMQKVIVYGIKETDAVVNTIGTGKRRSIADTLYRSSLLSGVKKRNRKAVSKMLDTAIKQLWYRTGANAPTNLGPRKTHMEAMMFLEHHKQLLDAVNLIFTENTGKKKGKGDPLPAPIGSLINPGVAAAALYMMGCSDTDGDAVYRFSDLRSEDSLDWGRWDSACEFWVKLAGKAPVLADLIEKLGELNDPITGRVGRVAEKLAVLAKAWPVYLQGFGPTKDDLELTYHFDNFGNKRLDGDVTFGGIDLGEEQKKVKKVEGKGSGKDDDEPTLEEIKKIEEAKQAIQASKKPRPKGSKGGGKGKGKSKEPAVK